MRTKLLLADDSITIQKVVGIIFASEDYELTIVNNGDAALAKAREIMPDVLLVDAVMPGKTGYEVCEEIRRDPALKETPILLLTGAFEPIDEAKTKQCGADDSISKPFESQHLIEKVADLVDLARERKAAPPVAPVPDLPPPPQPAEAGMPLVFPEEPAPAPAVTAAPAVPEFKLEVVEGTADDDLWGAFELEDLSEGEPVESEETAFDVESFAVGMEEVPSPFEFAEEEPETVAIETESAARVPEWETAGEPVFGFEEEPASSAFEITTGEEFGGFEEEATPLFEASPAEAGELLVETFETTTPEPADIKYAPPAEQEFAFDISLEETTPAPAPSAGGQEFELQFAPEEEYVPAPETPAPAAPVAPIPSPPATFPTAATGLSEEQLAAALSKISRDVIEKIVWEVVPDLAERLISEEIRKIKEGM